MIIASPDCLNLLQTRFWRAGSVVATVRLAAAAGIKDKKGFSQEPF
jgi:hypothetical protein